MPKKEGESKYSFDNQTWASYTFMDNGKKENNNNFQRDSLTPKGIFQTEKCFHSILLTPFSSLHFISIKMLNEY